MRIALLSFEYPPETGFGGIGTYTWHQARALVKLGHEVHVFAGATKPSQVEQSEHDGVRVFRFRANGTLMDGFRKLDKFRLWWSKNRLENALSMYRAFGQIKRSHRYDVVEMPECGAEGLFINNLMHIPSLVRFHSPSELIMPYYDVRRLDIKICSFLERGGYRLARAFSSCSKFMADQASQKLGIRKPVRVIPNGIDVDLFDRSDDSDVLRNYGISADAPVVLFSGRLEGRKGIHLCKEIVPKILEKYQLSFVFAGDDLFQHMSNSLIPYWKTKKLKGTFHHLGRLNQQTMRALMRRSRIFFMPSLWENCPYSCLEAMAARCAIVSTDQGGMSELIQNESNGLLARDGDQASYIGCLERLIEDAALCERLGSQARKTVETTYTDVQIAQSSTEYYQQCLNGHQ